MVLKNICTNVWQIWKVERPEFLTSLYEIFPELSNAPDKEKNAFLVKIDDYEIFTLLSIKFPVPHRQNSRSGIIM